MAIKINGTQVVDDSRNFTNIESVNGVAVAPAKPAITSPTDGFQTLDSSITFQSTAFEGAVVSDDHASSDWELATDSGFTNIVASLTDSTSNLTSWTVSNLSLDTYFVRVRHSGATLGDSEFSDAVSFSIVSQVMYGWGLNFYGNLGTNDTNARTTPSIIFANSFTDWTDVFAGQTTSYGIRQNGVIYSSGENSGGKLGDGTTTNRSSPVTVVGGITDWIKTDGGERHTLAIRSNGVLYAWGDNFYYSLGTNDGSNRSSPVTVVGGITDWKEVAAGGSQSLGLTSSSILYAWGSNNLGQLGTNNTSDRSSPVTVVGGITNWSSISAAGDYSLGLTESGTIYTWGSNNSGQLGTNDGSNRSSPVDVVGGITDWNQVKAGFEHVVATRSNGVLYAWGNNYGGKLGDGTTTNRSSPVTVVGGITDWSIIEPGRSATFAVRSDGTLYGWGRNKDSVEPLGDGTTTDRSSPVTFPVSVNDWVDLASTGDFGIGVAVE